MRNEISLFQKPCEQKSIIKHFFNSDFLMHVLHIPRNCDTGLSLEIQPDVSHESLVIADT